MRRYGEPQFSGIRIGSCKPNGINRFNEDFKKKLLGTCELDIICLNETYLRGNDSLSIDGYISYVNKRVPKGSGGVALLVKDALLNVCKIYVVDRQEGILGVSFTDKFTKFNFIIFVCYPLPENSVWGRDGGGIFSLI